MCRWDAVRVLIDDQLVVGAIDRVVQHGLVQTDLHVLRSATDRYSVERLSDLGRHGIPDVFFATLGGVRALRVSKRDPDVDACPPLFGEKTQDPPVFGEEQRAVGQDADLALAEPKNRIQTSRGTAERCGYTVLSS